MEKCETHVDAAIFYEMDFTRLYTSPCFKSRPLKDKSGAYGLFHKKIVKFHDFTNVRLHRYTLAVSLVLEHSTERADES